MKKTIAFILAVAMVLSLGTSLVVNASAEPTGTPDEAVVTSIQGIIDYLGDSAQDPVTDGKNIVTLLTETLNAYKADPSEENLNAIVSAWDSWTYGGHDAHDVFWTTPLLNYIDMFPKNDDGSVKIEAGAAKKTPEQLMEFIQRVDDTLYEGTSPDDYIDGTISTQFIDGDTLSIKAMNEAATAAEACDIFYDIIDFCNENCILKTAVEAYDTLDNAKSVALNTAGDPEALATLQMLIEYCETELSGNDEYGYPAYPQAGFCQYRPSGAADSFVEDTVSYSQKFASLSSDLSEFVAAYEATLPEDVPYEEQIAADVVSAMDAIIAYLDIPSVTIDDDLQVALDAYEADPNAETLGALVGVWDGWTYGGQDADCVFFSDYFVSFDRRVPDSGGRLRIYRGGLR